LYGSVLLLLLLLPPAAFSLLGMVYVDNPLEEDISE